MKSLFQKIYQKRSVMVGLEKAKCFLNALRNITGSVATVDDRDLMNHYRIFVANLEILFIKSYKEFDPSIFGSKEIIQSILKKENIALFRNVTVIIHLICIAWKSFRWKCCRKPGITIWKNTLILHDSLLNNILWTKWSLLRTDLYYIILMKF